MKKRWADMTPKEREKSWEQYALELEAIVERRRKKKREEDEKKGKTTGS